MRLRTAIIALIATLGLLLSSMRTAIYPSLPAAEAAPAIPVEHLLNLDGTLRVDGTFSGTLDVSGWQVALDPQRGPVLQSLAGGAAQWTNLGYDPNGALSGMVNALAVNGGDVYVGGQFTNTAGIPEADYVARFDTTTNTWYALGSNGSGNGALNSPVASLAVSGGDVYVGGQFTNTAGIPEADYVARFDTTTNRWHALGSDGSGNGALNGWVRTLVVSNGNVYVGGSFTDAAGLPEADYVARWDGSTWYALGSDSSGNNALNGEVDALAVSGSNVYVGGSFTDAAGLPEADYVARWDGSDWYALGGSGDGVLNSTVTDLAVSGSDVYVGGWFTNAASIAAADYVARWDGSRWHALGSNASGDGALNGSVRTLGVSGSDVYAGGNFTDAAGIPEADYVARFDTTTTAWYTLGSTGSGNGALNGLVSALAVSGSEVYVGGSFINAAGIPQADYVTRFDTTSAAWHTLGSYSSSDGVLKRSVFALAVSGGDVYVGGQFTNAAGIPEADYVARWDGSKWHALGSNGSGDGALYGVVFALAVSGNDVYVGGSFTDVAGIPEADYVVRWDGSRWHALGSNGVGDGALYGVVSALAVSGGDVYVGGGFRDAAGIPAADSVARWDGSRWHELGSNGSGDGALLYAAVFALAVSGGDLYVGGGFTNAAGIEAADNVARWDGSRWHALGSNASGNGALYNNWVRAIAVSGSDVYVGGQFTDAAGIPQADFVARWDGSRWHALGSNASGDGALNNAVFALAMSGGDLYVGGQFTDAAGIPQADRVARWDGSRWHALGSNGSGDGALNSGVFALAVSGNDVYVGGDFRDAAGIPAADHVAAYAIPPSVQAITRINPNPASAASVQFQVRFDEPVAGVTADDFALTATGTLSGASITSVSGSGATYTVTVTIGAGAGTLRLDIPASATISDLAGLRVNNLPFTAGESYLIPARIYVPLVQR